MSSPEQNGHSVDDHPIDASAMQAELEALQIPAGIDPRLLALWLEREQDAIEREQRKYDPAPLPEKNGRSLTRLFPAYIGITVMCLSIILGLIQRQEPTAILQSACIAFLVYTVIGIFVGMIVERCVNDSVETLLRDIVRRSRDKVV